MPAGQDGHIGHIVISPETAPLFLERFTAVERLSEPFTITCEVLSNTVIDFSASLGAGTSVEVQGDELVGRYFHGVLTEASQLTVADGMIRYLLVLRPWFWLMSLGRNSRIFQNMSAQTIITTVFNDANVSADTFSNAISSAGVAVRNYCVQYDESDFNFVSRIMEEEGIYYFFTHEAGQHKMILCDGPSSHSIFSEDSNILLNRTADRTQPNPHLWTWDDHVRPTPATVSMRDVNMMRWGQTLDAKKQDATAVVASELFYYPGGYSHIDDAGQTTGDHFASVRLQAVRAEKTRYTGAGDVFAVPVGSFVTVEDGDAVTTKVLVTAAAHSFEGQQWSSDQDDELRTDVSIEGIPADTTWCPVRRTPKPVARGPQVAKVVGAPGDVINTDAYGRIHVKFAWDRAVGSDASSSCWIRVSQGWADGGFGQIHIPRVGEEVIVDFFDGDMDRPVVTGRVYNSTLMPPYTLPDEKTKSTWKSQTVGDSGSYPDTVNAPDASTKGYNEIRFEDKGGSEEVWVHAQRVFNAWYRFDEIRVTGHNTTINVGYNRDITIKNNETKTVSEGDESHTISQGSLTTEITQGDETRKVVAGKRTTTIKQDEVLEVQSGALKTTVDQGDETHTVSQGKRTTSVMGDDSLTVTTGNYSLTVSAGTVSVTSPTKITLAVNASSIEITDEGITIAAPMITLQAEAVAKIESAMIQVDGSAMVQVQGAMVMIN